MHDFELDRLRQQLDDGEAADGYVVCRLLDDVVALRRRIGQPTNVHLETWVDPEQPSTWRVSHPLLRMEVRAGSAADALVLAAADLRKQLSPTTGSDDDDLSGWTRRRVDRADWEARANGDDANAEAMRGALARIDALEAEVRELSDHGFDVRTSRKGTTEAERRAATERLQARSRERLTEIGVESVVAGWRANGFGSLAEHGIVPPVLVVATTASADRSTHADHVFGGGRRWIALDHRCSDGVGSSYLTLVATPLETDMATHGRLGQLTQLAAARQDTVGHLLSYRDTVTQLFGDSVTVDDQRGPVGGGCCWPLDLTSLTALAGLDPADPDTWASSEGGSGLFSFGPHWQLLLLADGTDEGAW